MSDNAEQTQLDLRKAALGAAQAHRKPKLVCRQCILYRRSEQSRLECVWHKCTLQIPESIDADTSRTWPSYPEGLDSQKVGRTGTQGLLSSSKDIVVLLYWSRAYEVTSRTSVCPFSHVSECRKQAW